MFFYKNGVGVYIFLASAFGHEEPFNQTEDIPNSTFALRD